MPDIQARAFTELAAYMAGYFHEMLRLGFTREEALRLTLDLQRSTLQKGQTNKGEDE